METPVRSQQNASYWKQSHPKKYKYLETVRSQRNTSIWKHQSDYNKIQEYQSDHNEIQVFGHTSQITIKYKYLETPDKLQQNTSAWKQSDPQKTSIYT